MSKTSQINTLLLLLILALSVCTQPVCGNAELRALMQIKSSLDPGSKILSSWVESGDPCGGDAFTGVACNEHRKVANISLQGKGLAGNLSPAVAELKCLSGLYLHYNFLTGEIPKEIANLTELNDLYLNNNNLSGNIPTEIGTMASLQALELCCNNLTGTIPNEVGFPKRLTTVSLERNTLTGSIPSSLGDLPMLRRLDLSDNLLSGPIPTTLANPPALQFLNVENNTLSGFVPPGLKKLNDGFTFLNNPGLCGANFSNLRACTSLDNVNVNQINPPSMIPRSVDVGPGTPCALPSCTKSSSRLPTVAIVVGVTLLAAVLTVAVVAYGLVRYRRNKQKVGHRSEVSDDRLSIDLTPKTFNRTPSPLVALEYSTDWDPVSSRHESLKGSSKFNLEEIESATQHFSEVNLLGKSKFSAVHTGILKDGSIVAIKSISKTSCKTDEDEFISGLSLLNSLKHENLVKLRGFCCSIARGECFLVYDYAPNGNLSQYLDVEDGKSIALNWPTRVSIIHGIAKGIEYLHSRGTNKPSIIHQNISVEKVLLDQNFRPLILDSGLLKLLADDVVFSAIKVSAALGYMAPEYITTGRFTEKSDVYAFGVIILQVLSGKTQLSSSMRTAAESSNFEDFIQGKFSPGKAAQLTKIALDCTRDNPDDRPSMEIVVQELDEPSYV